MAQFGQWSSIFETIRSQIKALGYNEDQQGKAFIIAADTGDLDKIQLHCMNHGVHYIDEYGQRPLHRASRRGHAAATRMLLQFGSDPNTCDRVGGYSAIQYAAHYQHCDVVRLLISYGADPYYHNHIACRPAIYYAMKFDKVREAIQAGTSDLFIHRSIASNFLIDNLPPDWLEGMTLKHSIAMVIVEFLPRHQLWTEVKTRVITNSTKNWHSSDLFSEKHLESERENVFLSCKYHGEFDIDKDWETLLELQRQRDLEASISEDGDDEDYSSSESDDILISDDAESSDDLEEEQKYGDGGEGLDYSTTSQTESSHSSVSGWLLSQSSLSEDDEPALNQDDHSRNRSRRKRRHRNRTRHSHRVMQRNTHQTQQRRLLWFSMLLVIVLAVICGSSDFERIWCFVLALWQSVMWQ